MLTPGWTLVCDVVRLGMCMPAATTLVSSTTDSMFDELEKKMN